MVDLLVLPLDCLPNGDLGTKDQAFRAYPLVSRFPRSPVTPPPQNERGDLVVLGL